VIISAVTLVVPKLDQSLEVYCALGYSLLERGHLQAWDVAVQRDSRLCASAFARLNFSAECGQVLEVVEYPSCVPMEPFRALGWAAIELLVLDLDEAYRKVQSLGLSVWGKPKSLSFTDNIRAMQVLGPAGELIYFTERRAPVADWPMPQARTQYDQCFVVILCSHRVEVSNRFYADLFQRPEPTVIKSRVIGLSMQAKLPEDSLHSISAMPLRGGHWLEFDQGVCAEISRDSNIVAGIFSIAITVDRSVGMPDGLGVPIGAGKDTGCFLVTGPSGERINWYQEQGV
jgi:catechol 2,3-dioxygenase-like lactoylglutathione lyase family enzyme